MESLVPAVLSLLVLAVSVRADTPLPKEAAAMEIAERKALLLMSPNPDDTKDLASGLNGKGAYRRGFAAAALTVQPNGAAVGNTQWFDRGQVPAPPFSVLGIQRPRTAA